jgi:lysophospholipase L1-like esterase
MKTILCYGDSNTWGYIPASGARFTHTIRWPAIIQNNLERKVLIIEEGLCGRTTVFDEPFREGRNGKKLLYPLLESHSPIDLVILMIGTNDLKSIYKGNAYIAAAGVDMLADIVLNSACGPNGGCPELLLMSPPVMKNLSSEMAEIYSDSYEAESNKFSYFYNQIANKHGCNFLDVSTIASPSQLDGVHFDENGHKILAKSITKIIEQILF